MWSGHRVKLKTHLVIKEKEGKFCIQSSKKEKLDWMFLEYQISQETRLNVNEII